MNPANPEIKKRQSYGGGNHKTFMALGLILVAYLMIRSGQKVGSCTEWTVEQGYSQAMNSVMGWHPMCSQSIALDYLAWSLFMILAVLAFAPKINSVLGSIMAKARKLPKK